MSARLHVILDLDGTLIDSEALALRAWTHAVTGLGFPFGTERFLQMLAMNRTALGDFFARVYGSAFPFAVCWEAYDAERARLLRDEGVAAKPGALELAQALREREIPYCVATSSPTELALSRLERAGLREAFADVLGGENVTRGKPQPDIFLLAARRLNAQPADCVAVEDSDPGVRAAAAAGMRVLLVPDLQAPTAELAALTSAVLPDLFAVRDWLPAQAGR